MKTENVKYLRDGRAPIPKKESTSRVMSANRGSGTKPEVILGKALWKEGLRGYRRNWRKIPGRPDIVFAGKKIAIFINGCFWHKCPKCNYPLPKSNKIFWDNKFERNIERDKKTTGQLHDMGWKVLTIWEHEIEKNLDKTTGKIVGFIKKSSGSK